MASRSKRIVGTRVYIYLSDRWQGLVKGLCGNFDGNSQNEYESSQGGVVLQTEFTNSWRKESSCPVTTAEDNILEACGVRLR